MVEIKLSQDAKPGHGGVLPAVKNTKVDPPAYHTTFSDAKGLLQFFQQLRKLSGGKPCGFKLRVGRKEEFVNICQAMLETGIMPDFITIDGSEGGTGATPIKFSDSIDMPLEEALVFVTDKRVGMEMDRTLEEIYPSIEPGAYL